MKRLIYLLFISLPCLSQQAILEDFSLGSRNGNTGFPLWQAASNGTGQGSNAVFTGGHLFFTNTLITQTPYSVASISFGNPGGPFSSNCSTPSTPCGLVTMSAPAPWSAPPSGIAYQNFIFSSLTTSGSSCSTWTQYAQTGTYNGNPSFALIQVNDSTHFWFLFGSNIETNPANCSLVSVQILNACINVCAGNVLENNSSYLYSTNGFMAQTVIPGQTFTSSMNRLKYQFKSNTTVAGGNGAIQFGTFVKAIQDLNGGNQGDHPYHGVDPFDVYAGVQYYAELGPMMTHDSTGINGFPVDYPFYNEMGSHMYTAMTHFYINSNHSNNCHPGTGVICDGWANATIQYDNFILDTLPSTYPFGMVGAIWYGYTGNQPGITTGRYDMAVEIPQNGPGNRAEIRYSTSDMLVNGFSSGTSWGTTFYPSGGSTNFFFSSPDIAAGNPGYIAIRPTMEIDSIITDGGGHMLVNTGDIVNGGFGSDPYMHTNDTVTIANVLGCTVANNNWTVTLLPQTSFPTFDATVNPNVAGPLQQVQVLGWSIGDGTLTNIVGLSGVATATYSGGPTPTMGETVWVSGTGQGPFDNGGAFTITAATGSTFTFTVPGLANGTYTASANISTAQATATISVAHGLTVGRTVSWISTNSPPSVITSVPSSTTFSYTWMKDPTDAWPSGTYLGGVGVTGFLYVYQAYELQGSGGCNSAFIAPTTGGPSALPYMVATTDHSNFAQIVVPGSGGGASGGSAMSGNSKVAGNTVIKP